MNAKDRMTGSLINASPMADHSRQMRLQVWLPLGLVILLVLALVVLTIVGAAQGSPQIERWGNLSAVVVIIPVLFSALVFLIIIGASIYGMSKLLKKMPDWMLRLQLRMVHIALAIRRAADAATQPVMKTNTIAARVQRFWNKVIRGR